MIKYPMHFKSSVKSTKGINTPFEGQAEHYSPIQGAIPKEFGGPGGAYSPEDLYVLALTSCLIATFKVFAEKANIAFEEITGDATLAINRDENGMAQLQKIEVTMTLTGVGDQERAKTILKEAEKFCLVSNAIKSEKVINYQFK